MKRYFHNRFHRTQFEVTIVDLMNLKQVDEMDVDFIERFKKPSSKCMVQLPGFEYVAKVMANMDP